LPQQEEIVLTPVEISALLSELREPFLSLIVLASVTGLRRGELFGLKWEDVDFNEAEITVVGSIVDQVEGPPKTLASRRPIPMSQELASSLENWKKQTSFASPRDWVFDSQLALGEKPYWPDAVLKRHILPAAKRACIAKRIGWHSFRRTLATLLLHWSIGEDDAGTIAALLASDDSGVYAKAVTQEKRDAQATIASLFGLEASTENHSASA
jgi:integrase